VLSRKGLGIRTDFKGTDKIGSIKRDHHALIYRVKISDICEKIVSGFGEDTLLIEAEVVRINSETVVLSDREIEHSRIISTIDPISFSKIFPSWSKNFVSSNDSEFYFSIGEIEQDFDEIIYFEEGNITKQLNNVAENASWKEYKEYPDVVKKGDKIFSRKGVRFNNGKAFVPPEGVIFVGRFSTGNVHWRIEDSIFVAKKGLAISEFIAEQQRFDTAVKEKKEMPFAERLQHVLLGLHSEVSELAESINFKLNRPNSTTEPVDAEKILMDFVDIFKYALSIANEFNFTPREIYDGFFEKSDILWKRFVKEFYGGT
jgi:hypothetical protein